MMTHKIGITFDTPTPYFDGHELHLYMGPRRTFGKMRKNSLRAELLKTLGLAALIKLFKKDYLDHWMT